MLENIQYWSCFIVSYEVELDKESHLVVFFCVQGLGTDEETLIEIVCSRSNKELVEIKKVYKDSKCCSRNLVSATEVK